MEVGGQGQVWVLCYPLHILPLLTWGFRLLTYLGGGVCAFVCLHVVYARACEDAVRGRASPGLPEACQGKPSERDRMVIWVPEN